MNLRSPFVLLCLSLLHACMFSGTASADEYITNFESFTLGSINGQQGWFIPGANNALANIDQEIVDLGAGNANSGSKAWRLSNRSPSGNPNGSFSMPQTPTVGAAGESTTGAAFDSFRLSFAFKAVSSMADGTKIDVDFAPSSGAGQASDDRKTLFRLNHTAAGGVNVGFFDTVGNNFVFHDFGVVDRDWHTVDLIGMFPDGPGGFDSNDSVEILIDGASQGFFNTWESWREGNFGPLAILDVNHVMFHIRDPEPPFNTLDGSSAGFFRDPQGFYFDDVSIESFNSGSTSPVPEPASIAIWALLGLATTGFGYFRIKRKK